jgi:TPR repeat protein
LIRRAAEAGDVKAMNKLGILYQNKEVTLNCPEAFKWVQKAAEAGDVEGMRSLGAMFYHGLGVAPNASNDARAFEWFQKAANREDMQSMYNLGVLYEHGRGVSRDYDQARHWYQKAANAGYPLAPGALWRLDSK